MKLERELGGYSRWMARTFGSFRISAGAADRIRDGKSGLIKSVTRNAAGKYTVALADGLTVKPSMFVLEKVGITAASSTPTKVCQAHYVDGSWDSTAKTFDLLILETGTVGGAAAAPVVADPDDGCRVYFELVGSISSVGTDAA